MPRIRGIFETVLYAADAEATARFYRDLLGLPISSVGDVGLSIRMPDSNMLLIFDPQRSGQPGREVPSSGASGPGHICFRISSSDYATWKKRLRSLGVAIEHEHVWPNAVRSIYFRDPAGNSVELADGDLWPTPPPQMRE